MGNKCCKNQSSTYSSANATIRSFSSYNSSILRSGGSHAITFGTSTLAGDSLTTLTMKSSNHSDVGSKDYRGGSSSTVGQEDLIPIFLRRLNDLNIRVGTRTRFLIELDDATDVQVRWYHNNVEANNERYQYIHEGGFYCLDIVPVTLFDEGLWVCTAQNYAGKSSTAAHLSLTVPKAFKKPIFVEQLKAVLTQRGIVSLECKVIGVPTPKLRWYKDDKEIKAGDIFALTANSEEDCLGIYTCEATNVMGTALSTSKIQVTHTPLDGNHDADSLIPYGPPPKFAKFLKDASGKVGSVLFLECQVDVPPWPRSIGWYNDNGIVNEGPLYHLMADGLGMYGVEIKSLRADHSTTWKCIATSSTGVKAVTSCVVSVSYPKNYRVPRFLESLRAIMTDEGLVSFECKVIGYPTPQLSWFKDGKQLQPGDVYELTGSKSLGSYCCVARNCMGETSSLAELTIEDIQNQLNESEKLQLTSNTQPPRFLLGLKSIEANINESFVFMIKVSTESTASISWYKEDEELTESNRYQFSTEDNGTYILNIMPLEIDDQAEWKCVAINKYGQTATSSFLKLNIPKNFKSPRFLEELRIAFSNEGSVNLECKVIGVPQPQLKWFKDGQELNPGDMHKIISGQSGTCCLGTYTCQAHNCMGTVSSSATLLTMEDKSTVKSCASEEYLSVGNPLVRNESLSTIPEERTSQMEKSYTIEEPADISFSFDGKEVTVSLYETPDLTHDEALQIIEMYADELSEHISEDNVVDLPSLRIIKESSISGPVMMEALVIDVPIDYCRQQTVSDTEFDGVSLTEDITLANNDKSDSICENSLEYFSDHLSSGNSKREEFYSASETTPKNSSIILKQQSEDDGHQSFQTPKLFMSDSDDQILTQLKLDERLLLQNSRPVTGPLARSESNNTEEEVSETLAEIENEPPLSHNYCVSEIVTQSDEDGLYSTVLNKIRGKGIESVILSSEEDDVLKIISRPNVDEFLKYMKIILEGTMVKMHAHENFNFTSTMTELERSIQALHSLAWKFIEETERDNVTELDKNTADNVSSLMTAINASLLALEQIDDPFGVSDNVLNEIQSSVCFDFETLNNNDLPASVILDRLSGQIKNFTIVVNRQVARVTEQRIIAILRNTIGTTLVYIKTLQHNCFKIKCVDINSLTHLFSMVQPLETILNDIAIIEDASIDDNKPNLKLKQILIPPISSIAFALNNLNTALNNDSSDDDQDLKDIYKRINESTNKFMTLASQGTESNKIAECFISFTKPINDLCCHLRRLGRSTENIVSSDYGSDDKLLLDFETLFDELMIDIDTLINNVNFVQDSENNMNPLGSLLEPLQDMKIGLFQVNQVLLSNQTGSTMSYEVMNCFEHLSQQLVQLNNCIVNQSIVEETEKEIPFESSIKMMQNILFDDAIDDLGVNGILFGSVMKPLLQLQNLIVSKMASVESDLSFSEHTDVTGGACDTQSLSLSLSNNAQTVFDKTANENSKQVITESSIIDSLYTDCDKQKNIHRDTSEVDKDSILIENNINNDLVIKRGYECDIGETFKDEEPNIITSEDDRDNSGLEALFDETDLETISDFVEDTCLDNTASSKIDHKLSDLFISEKDIDNMLEETDDIVPEHVLESLEKSNQQDLIFNSPVDLLNELQDTLKNMSEVARVETTELYGLCTSNINDLQKMDSAYYINQICDKTNNLLHDSLDVEQMNNSTNINSDKLNKQNVTEPFEDNIETNQCNKIILKTDQNETFKNKDISISDQDVYKEEKVFEKGQDVDFVENFESLNSDKSISNNTIITVDEISDSSEVKMKEIDTTINLESVDNVASTTEKFSQIMYVPDINESLITYSIHNMMSEINDNAETITTSSDLKNETVLLDNLNFTESVKNINILSKKDIIIDKNKFNESEKINTLNDHGTENKDTVLIKEIEVPSITENVSPKSFSQNDVVINEIDANCNSGTDMIIPVAQTSNVNEFNTGKEKEIILIDKCTTEFNNVLGTLVEEKNCIAPENNLVIEDHNSPIVEEISNKIKQYDNSNLINKSIYVVEEKVTPINEPICSVVDNNSITVLENNIDNISKDIIEEQNSENEHLSLIKNKYNDSDIFEISQDVNLDEKLQHELQPNINTTSTTDNKQIIVTNFIKSENMANPIGTELNVLQTEEHALIKNHTNLSELTNKESLENVQQSYILQQSNNEVNTVEELNEQNDILSDMKVNNEIECISSKIVLPTEIINPENVINVRSVVEQCVSDSIIHTDDKSITQYNVDNCVDFMLPVIESMTQKVGSNELDKQLVITNTNTEANEDKGEDHDNFDDIAIKSKIDVTKDFENLVDLTLNEKETASNEKINKYSENKTTQIKINDEEKSINTISNSFGNFKQPNILENNNTALLDENQDDIQFKVNIDSIYECNTILDSKDKISNLEQLETKKELLYIPDENEVETKLSSEVQNLQNDETKLITKSANIVVKQTTALICNEIISTSNAQPLDPILIDVENIKEQYEKELCVSESKNITVLDDIIDTVEKNNQQFDDVEEMSKDKLISKPLDTNNLTYDGNESEKSIPNEYIEGLKSIDEKSNSASSENIVKNNGEILEKINNLSTENVEEKILTKSQMSDESGVDDSLVENNCVTTFVDLKTTKTNIEKEEDICKIHASEISCLPLDKDQISGSNNLYLYDAENNLDKHKCLSLVKENKDNCNDRTSYPNTCIEILNENNVNQHKQFSECQTIVILENFDTLDTLLHKENTKTNTVIRDNEDKLNINEDSVETKNRSEQNSIKNDTDKKQSPILIDVSKSMENKTDLVNNRNQTLCLCDTKFDNLNEKLTEDLKNNQEIDENNFGKLLVHKNNLEDTDNLKNNEINTEEIKTKFINLKDFETLKTKLETTVDNIPKVDSNKSTKQKDLTFEKLSNLVIDELNISLETPKSECIFVNKNIDNKIIDLSKSNIFNNDNLHIDAEVDIIDQYDDSCKTEIQDMSDKSKEIINVISKNYPDNDSCDSNNSPLNEVQENKSNTINENEENKPSKLKLDNINVNEDKLLNEVKMNDQMNVVTALENNANPLNDILFEGEISDMSAEEFGVISIMPKFHYVEKIAASGTECMMLENTNNLKQDELNAAENLKQHAQVEHELNIGTIGNIIIDNDSIKENSLTADDEKKCINNAIIVLTSDDSSLKIVSTNVDVLNAPTKDTTIKKDQIVINDLSENSTRTTMPLSENRNSEILTVDKLNDQIEIADNLIIENDEINIGSMDKSIEILNDKVVDKLQQSFQNAKNINSSLVISADENDTTEKVNENNILIDNIKTTNDKKTTNTKDKVDIKQKLNPKSKESSSQFTPTNNIGVYKNNIDKNKITIETIVQKNKELSDEIANTEQVTTKFKSEELTEKDVITDDQNKNQKNNGVDNNNKTLTESELEEGKNKRRSKKKRTSPQPESKKSPLLDTSEKDLSAIENEIDTNKIMDTNIVEKNKINSDDNKNTDKVDVKMDKTESTIVPDNIRNLEEKIEKDVSTNDQYQNQNNEITIDNQIKSTENDEEKDETKRSKKKKSSPQIKDKKSTSPVSTKINFTANENKIGSIIIDKNIEENNKKLSEENNDTENVDVKLNKIDPAIASDNKINPEEIIDKGVSTDDQIKNQKNNGIDNNSKTLTENEIEEKNKKNSDDNKNTEKVEVKIDKIEPTIVLDNIKNSEEIITKDVSNINKNKNLKNNEYDEDAKLLEHRKDKKKRGSKKKKTSPEPEIKKLSSTDTKKNNINISEDDTVEENIRKISNDNKNTEQDRTKVEPGTTADNNTTKIIDKIKSAEHFVEKSETNPGSRKEKISSPRPEGEKSTSPNKTNKITNEKLKKNNEIEKNENTISDLTENFTKHLPDINTVLDKMEKLQDICSLDNNNIEIIGKSKNNKIETHLFTNTDKSDVEKNKNERDSVKLETSSKSPSLEKSVRTDTKVNVNIDDKLKNNTTNCFTTNKERKLPEMTEQDVVDVPEVRVLNKRPVNRYLLDVNDVHNLRQNTPAYRSLTPDPLASYRTLTPDHLSSHRSLTPESPSYRTSLTPRSKYAYACLSDRELYGRSSSNHSSRSSSRSTSPYPPESRISSRSLCPTNITAYRCLSETSIPLSPRRLEVETISGRLHTSYGVTTRRRRGSDSFLHDSGVRDGGYYSSWRLSDGRSTTYGAFEDLYRTKEAFKALYFCVRMIDQTVSSGARVKFWCSIIGHPKPRVQWYRDGQKLNSFTYNSSARYETKYDGGLAQLIINNAQSGDSGEYTCVASNDHDRISSTGFLTVYTSPSMFRKSFIQPSMSVDVIEFSRGLYSRTSHDFGLSANTKFDFNSRKLFGGDLANRRPEYPKFVSSIIADDVATYGGTIALQVRVQGSPVPNVTWMRESRPLPRLSGKYVYLDEGGLYTLLVMDSTARDGGTYVCRACNLYGAADAEKAVRVVSPQDYTDRRGVKPAIIVSRPNDRLNVAVGEDITVNLRVAGEPKPKVIWMRGSRDVTFLDRSLKETVNDYVTLSIKKAQPSDAGTYFIIAKNVYGSDRAFVTVGVSDRIGAGSRSTGPGRDVS